MTNEAQATNSWISIFIEDVALTWNQIKEQLQADEVIVLGEIKLVILVVTTDEIEVLVIVAIKELIMIDIESPLLN